MKRFLGFLLCLALTVGIFPLCLPASADTLLHTVVRVKDLGAFEEDYTGYDSSFVTVDGHEARMICRNDSKVTSYNFNLYHWGLLYDENEELIPLSGTNYMIMEYYYESPDDEPVLVAENNRPSWVQGRVVPEDDLSGIVEHMWSTHLMPRNEMVANQWATLVFPFCENPTYDTQRQNRLDDGKEYYLHQIKLFPLEMDMGENDKLYIGNITFQSWNPDDDAGLKSRKVSYYLSDDAVKNGDAPLMTSSVTDLDRMTVPGFPAASLPENATFLMWHDAATGRTYKEGSEYVASTGEDVNFVAEFCYTFDYSAFDGAYINGYPDGTYRPQAEVTRAEAVKMLASTIGSPDGSLPLSVFGDIPADAWYRPYAALLDKYHALGALGEKFNGDRAITRSEFVRLLYALSDRSAPSKKLVCTTDITHSEPCYDAVVAMMAQGVVTGYDDGTFKPLNKITRAEIVTMINRFIGRVPQTDKAAFPDTAGHWAQAQIAAASSDKASGAFTYKDPNAGFVLTGTHAEEYIKALREQSPTLSSEAVRAGIDTVADKMKEDILGSPNTVVPEGATVYYLSSEHGDDNNDGRTPETAWKTITKLNTALIKRGAYVLFERGGLWRGHVGCSNRAGITFGSYGEGEKPLFLGSPRDFADETLWLETDIPNVYQCAERLYNVGVMAFDHDIRAHGNYDAVYGKNRILSKDVATYADMCEDLQFFSCNYTLYLYSDKGNPGKRFHSIEIGVSGDIFDGAADDVTFDNLAMKYGGCHGIGFGTCKNLTVTNCEFSWIGGSLLGQYGQTTVQFGNAVEIFGSCDGYLVHNNWMYQIYDTAVTHQNSTTSEADIAMNDIEYSENLMEYVHWGVEFYISQGPGDRSMTNYRSAYNVLRMGGYGWGSIVTDRQQSARLYSCSTLAAKNSNLSCEYNIIDRCAGYLLDVASTSKETFDSNIYVQTRNKTLGCLKGKTVMCRDDAAEMILDRLKDKNQIFILVEA